MGFGGGCGNGIGKRGKFKAIYYLKTIRIANLLQ
jgi:hypothetical protein